MKKLLFALPLFLCTVLWAQETPAPAPQAQDSAAKSADAYAQEIISRFGAVETLQSKFTQEKHLTLLTEPVESKGAFAFSKQGAQLRWEYTEPFQNGFLMDGGKTYRLEKGVKKTVKGVMSRNVAAQMLVWLTFDLKTLAETYDISYFEGGVTLTPNNDKNRLLDKITVWFAKDNPQALSEIRMDEPGGDYTLLRFYDTHINGPLPKDAFL